MALIRISRGGERRTAVCRRVSMGDDGDFEASHKAAFRLKPKSKSSNGISRNGCDALSPMRMRVKEAAESVKTYGESLFKQLFADTNARAIYEVVKSGRDSSKLRFRNQGLASLPRAALGGAEGPRFAFGLLAQRSHGAEKPEAAATARRCKSVAHTEPSRGDGAA